MHCSEFRDCHCAFVDDTLAGVELVRMQGHLLECKECAELDARVRRSLMAVRSLPTIQLSKDFASRLEARLHECRIEIEHAEACVQQNNFRFVATVGAMASLLMLGYVGMAFRRSGQPRDIVMPPVVATAERPLPPELQPTVVSPRMRGIVASVSAGMPLWPVAMFAEQGPIHFATYREAH